MESKFLRRLGKVDKDKKQGSASKKEKISESKVAVHHISILL